MRVRIRHQQLMEQISRSRLSQNNWAMRLGVSSGHMADLVNGRHPYPSPATRDKLLRGFGLEFEDLFEIDDPDSTTPPSTDLRTRFQAAIADRYIIDDQIGQGGMGTVYRGREVKHGRQVAIKVVLPDVIAAMGTDQFLTEIRRTANLQHPNILPLLDSGIAAECPYLVTPFVRSGSLRHLLERGGIRTPLEALGLLEGICRGLAYAHGEQVVHCDVKPENVLVSSGQAMLTDFGISRVIHLDGHPRRKRIDTSTGTPAYVSPEQVSGETVDGRSDQYSVACVAFELLTGAPPFEGSDDLAVVSRRFTHEPPDPRRLIPTIPAAVAGVVVRGMAFDARNRFPDTGAFYQAFGSAVHKTESRLTLRVRRAITKVWRWTRPRLGRLVPQPIRTIVPSNTRTGRRSVVALGERMLLDLLQDLRHSVRWMRRRRGFTSAAVSTLALGIGATVAIFSVVNSVLLRPLPYPDPGGLVVLWNVDTRDGSRSRPLDHPDIRYIQQEVSGLRVAGVAGSHPTLTGLGEPEVLAGARVSNGILGVFDLKPELGRDLTVADDVPNGPNVVLVSHAFWQSRLGGDRDVIGHTLQLDGESWEIVGVAPGGFEYPNGAVLWTPQHHDDEACGHGCNDASAIGRLEIGTTLDQVQARLDGAAAQLARAYPVQHVDKRIQIEPMLDVQVAGVKTALWVLLGAVAMLLLIACANVANLLLVHASGRTSEIALRAALGARRPRLVRQLLTESFLLSLLGGTLGLGLAAWGIQVMLRLAPAGIPRLDQAGIDGRAVGFALLVVVAVTAFFGLAPAIKLAGRPLNAAVGAGRRTEGGRGAALYRGLLLSGEVALSLMLLLGAVLLFGTLQSIGSQELGYATQHVDRFRITLPYARYDTPAVIRFLDELERRLDALPEVAVAGTGFNVPLAGGSITTGLEQLDRDPVPERDRPEVTLRPSSPGYQEALGLPLLRGRWFTAADQWGTEGVAVINKTAADRLYPGVDPLGRRVRMGMSWGFGQEPERTIVGIVGDARSRNATEPDQPALYIPNAQFGTNAVYVVLRLERVSTALPAARAVLQQMDPSLAVTNVERIEEVLDRQLAPTRFYLTLIGIFSVLALILAAVGLYGVVAYSVSRRTREIGIRVALGAQGREVVGMVVREGMGPALVGLAAGIVGTLAGGRVIASLLYGVEPQDPATLAGVTTVLLAVVLLATFVPARRASRVPPSEALRLE